MRRNFCLVLILFLLSCASAHASDPIGWWDTFSIFFRGASGEAVAVDASNPLPVAVTGGISITVGSTTFTAAPVFADSGGTGTVALVDVDRRIVANLGSDTIGLVTAVDAVTSAVSAMAAQLATETDSTVSAVDAVTASVASVTAELAAPLQVEAVLSTDSISLVSTIAAISTDLLAAFASQTLILEGTPGVTVATLPTLPAGTNTIGKTLDAAMATPTVTDADSTGTSATLSNVANRAYVVVQNKAATESAYVYPGLLATPGLGIEVQAGSSITRAWGSAVPVSYASTGTVPLVIDEEVYP